MEKYQCTNGHIQYSSAKIKDLYFPGCCNTTCATKVFRVETHDEFIQRAKKLNQEYISRLVTSVDYQNQADWK